MAGQQTLYDKDFFAWTREQAKLIKSKALDEVDFSNILEEIESMGRREKREIFSKIKTILFFLLKRKYQPLIKSGSWCGSINEARDELRDLLEDNPSLRNFTEEAITKKFKSAVRKVSDETGFSEKTFPLTCEWTIEQILDDEFFPD